VATKNQGAVGRADRLVLAGISSTATMDEDKRRGFPMKPSMFDGVH
jgi:hypothetical protein